MRNSTKLQQIRTYCAKHGIKLTPLRETILTLIYDHNQPIGAYDLLRALRKSRPNAEPPTVYRVLEFLLTKNLIHRVESKNAYVSCVNPEAPHRGQLLLCKDCGDAIEIDDPDVIRALVNCAKSYGFSIDNDLTEIRGRCQSCQ